jgi:hypothetical protein
MPAMTFNANKPSQFELFPNSGSPERDTPRQPFIIKDLTLSAENTIVLSIIFIVVLVVFFSIGVERGKRLARVPAAVSGEVAAVEAGTNAAEVIYQGINAPGVSAFGQGEFPKAAVEEAATEKREVLEVPIDEEYRYTIQVASFKSLQYAMKEAKALESKGHETFVMPKGEHQIVCIGKFAAQGDARQYARKIKDRYQDYLIRSR